VAGHVDGAVLISTDHTLIEMRCLHQESRYIDSTFRYQRNVKPQLQISAVSYRSILVRRSLHDWLPSEVSYLSLQFSVEQGATPPNNGQRLVIRGWQRYHIRSLLPGAPGNTWLPRAQHVPLSDLVKKKGEASVADERGAS